ncbi:hypothetical protein PENSPDRAFT_599275 [Peniophora sp. CONT]|nr:hypothetical protein PENSPDRAFT_599275 [Peniophora sp. CONT]
MRRGGSTTGRVSPTNTTYSGISNYKTDSYARQNLNQDAKPQDTREIARAHYRELSVYLASYLANEPANSRFAARQKLTRLTRQQFQELSTDVYDELVRRKNNEGSNDIPFLPVRDDFHPKRNQARQKLATLPTSRFKDLSSDVYYELVRRYPEFKEEEQEPEPEPDSPKSAYDDRQAYDDYPRAGFQQPRNSQPDSLNSTSTATPGYGHQASTSISSLNARNQSLTSPPLPPTPYTSTTTSTDYASPAPPRQSQDRDRYSPASSSGGPLRRQSEDDYAPVNNSRTSGYSASSRRRPSEDYNNSRRDDYNDRRQPSQDYNNFGRRAPSEDYNNSPGNVSFGRRAPSEDYGGNNGFGRRAPSDDGYGGVGRRAPSDDGYGGMSSVGRRPSATSSGSGGAGTSANMATSGVVVPAKSTIAEEEIEVPFGAQEDHSDTDEGGFGGGRRETSSPEYGGGSGGRGSRAGSDRGGAGVDRGGRSSVTNGSGGDEKVRREYEFRIATMQSKIVSLEREAEERASEVEEYRRRAEEQADEREKDVDEIDRLGALCKRLENELEDARARGMSEDAEAVVEQLRNDTEGLLTELGDVSARNDELIAAREADARTIRELENQVREWRKKYENAKTELRSIKATSQLFTQKPNFSDGNLPMSSSGGVVDIHITSFLASIDALLTAGRSNAPTRVLQPMKAVINAVTAITDDLRQYSSTSSSPAARPDELEALRERAEATLGNLVAAVKTHATAAGMAPVSLLDAAASHVAAAVTDIGRTVLIRRATRAEHEAFGSPGPTGFSPALKNIEELRGGNSNGSGSNGQHQRGFSSSSRAGSQQRPPSGRSIGGQSSSGRSASPAQIFDGVPAGTRGTSEDSGGGEDAWAELKPYLEAQTESIVFAIQSVLSGVRSPTLSPTLTENLTQIITIVSSIVAVCSDALPPNSSQGREILRELTEHANRLGEMQGLPEVTKESRQVMAKSSFAIANAMKGLQKI